MKQSNIRGFTLLELMMVVVIIGILAAVAIPNMGAWSAKKDLDAAARGLMNNFQQARSEAIKRNSNIDIAFTTNSYTVTTNGVSVIPQTTMPDGITIAANFPDGGGNTNATGYTSRGFALNQGSAELTSTKAPSGNNKRTIVLSFGGSVRIQ